MIYLYYFFNGSRNMKYTPLRQLTVCSITTCNKKLDVQDLYIENLGTTFNGAPTSETSAAGLTYI